MQKNISTPDKTIRLLFGIVVVILIATQTISGSLAWILGIAAVVLAVTAFINFCPIYAALGISTRKKEKSDK